ncbi:hypothetical protein DJ533_00205 (plasmid) [Acinetobacter defluvii]|uniref:Uncharacterized protein n=1 Tax=Acinetobacter defluvii TaxID=1871111 RepID=A0A2S2F829_9GAMM|nr:hypothetical protein [Acinetobacter defluvii]AWL27141.1 hypothetical protein DJ533_00205 [Acinetobacter defluvii]
MSTVGKEDETIIDAGGDDQQQLGGSGNGGDASGSQDLSTSTKNNEDHLSQVDEKPVSPKLDQSTKSDGVAAADPEPQQKSKRTTKSTTKQVPKPETVQPLATTQATNTVDSVTAGDSGSKQEEPEQAALDPLDLEITNHGSETSCMVTRKIIPHGETIVLRYGSMRDKHLAMGNFAQINALSGFKRFTFEG